MTNLHSEQPDETAEIEQLLDLAFGSDRNLRSSQKFREGTYPLAGLSFVAKDKNSIVGVIRFTSITIGTETESVLLGPIAVHPRNEGKGIGKLLMKKGLSVAEKMNLKLVVAIGNPMFLSRFGFIPAPSNKIFFPMSIPPSKLMVLELVEGTIENTTLGTIALPLNEDI